MKIGYSSIATKYTLEVFRHITRQGTTNSTFHPMAKNRPAPTPITLVFYVRVLSLRKFGIVVGKAR
jgi:hypothetical protein